MKTVISKKQVRILMVERGIDTFQELAEKAGISPTTLYSVLDSNRFTGKTLDAIAEALNVNPIKLLVVEGEALAPVAIAA